ncbi:MAG: hypothetical protein ACR2NU_07670 [Aeoliella sp.]
MQNKLLFASAQNDDLLGSCAFDGHDGPPVYELATYTEMPDGFIPLVFRLGGFIVGTTN